MGKRMLPLLAAVDGVVHRVTFNNTSSGGNSVTIKGADGWTYHYLHVNNDTPGTDDGKATRAQAFPARHRPRRRRARAARSIGYMGDSGNAESTSPHLHFEIRQPPPPGQLHRHADQPLRVAAAGHRSGARSALGPAPHRQRQAPPTSAFTYGHAARRPRAALRLGRRRHRRGRHLPRRHLVPARRHDHRRPRAGSSRSAPPSDTPLCGDLDGDGDDEPIALPQRHVDRARRLRAPATRTPGRPWYGVAAGDKPVLGDWDGDGDDDFGDQARRHLAHPQHRRRPPAHGVTVHASALQPRTSRSPATGTATATTTPASSGAARGTCAPTPAPAAASPAPSCSASASGQPLVGDGDRTPVRPGIGTFRPRTA